MNKSYLVDIIVGTEICIFVIAENLGIYQKPFCALYLLTSPEFTLGHFRIWQLLTANFFYSHPICLGLDIGLLWIVGRDVESRHGSREFLAFYLTACVVSMLGWAISQVLATCLTACVLGVPFSEAASSSAPAYMNGGSGAIMAILTFCALSVPAHHVRIFGVWTPTWFIAGAYLLFGVYAESDGLAAANAVQASVAGAVFAYVVRRFDLRLAHLFSWELPLHRLNHNDWYRIRFSVLSLLILVLLSGGWLGWLVRTAEVQRDAVAAIENVGGAVAYESAGKDGRLISGAVSESPTWLVERLGADYFGNVVGVSFQSRQGGSDVELKLIGRLARLEYLDLCDSLVTDAGLIPLTNLHGLRDLRLARTNVGDDGLLNLRSLTCVQTLDLSHTKMSSTSLVHLEKLKDLTCLDLSGTQIGDDGLALIGRMVQLRQLSLRGTQVSDAGLGCLRSLRNLEKLDLFETQITDAGLAHLKGMSGLELLYVGGTKVGDSGIKHLKSLSSLETLQLPDGTVMSGKNLRVWRRGEGPG